MRSLLDRVDAIGGHLPEAVVTVAKAEEAARNHAVAEGAPDPDPNPLLDEDGQQRRLTRTRGSARRREAFGGLGGGQSYKLDSGRPSSYCPAIRPRKTGVEESHT